MEERKLVDGFRALRLTVAAHIGSDGMEPRLGQRGELMPPGIPRFRKTVAQDHDRAATRFGDMHFNPVCTDGAMPKVHTFPLQAAVLDRKSTRLNSSHLGISYAVFCLKKKKHE